MMVRWSPCGRVARLPTPGSLPLQRFTKRSRTVCAISTLICGAKTIRILAVTLPAVAEWDVTMRPFRRWHRVDFEVREAT